MKKISIAGRKFPVPGHPFVRIALGFLLIAGGVFSILPVFGLWMIPLGIAILAIDFPMARRMQRRLTVWLGYWLHRIWPTLARRLGFGVQRSGK
ncbi:MAG: PGPGW domain-containing protein [Aestuariivirga sp.]